MSLITRKIKTPNVMFKLFKTADEIKQLAGGKSRTELLIEEIHRNFYNEADRLLHEANAILSVKSEFESDIQKAKELSDLGFNKTRHVTEINEVTTKFKKSQVTIEAIRYFSEKYPMYRFITNESVKRICDKYKLVYSSVGDYIGTVPDRNIQEMKNFKIKDEDACYEYQNHYSFIGGRTQCGFTEYKRIRENQWAWKSPLEIAAPVKDFDLSGKTVKDRKLVSNIPDPVVLQPVMFNDVKYYLIVTAWGLEASDPDVANSKMN